MFWAGIFGNCKQQQLWKMQIKQCKLLFSHSLHILKSSIAIKLAWTLLFERKMMTITFYDGFRQNDSNSSEILSMSICISISFDDFQLNKKQISISSIIVIALNIQIVICIESWASLFTASADKKKRLALVC